MKKLFLSMLGISLLLSVSSLHAYNNQWADNEDYVVPNETNITPGEGVSNQEINGAGICLLRQSSPVYTDSGHFTWSAMDIELPGKPGIVFSRSYTSKEPLSGMFGNGWISSFESGFIKTEKHADKSGSIETHYIYRQQEGLRYTFKEINDAIDAPSGMHYKIEKLSETSFKVTYPNNDIEIYANDVIVSKQDSNGNKLEYNYNEDTLLQEIKDSNGNSLKLTFGANGYVTALTDHTQRTWRYTYDEDGNLITVTDPLNGSRNYTYEKYQADNDAQAYYHLTKITDETGVVITEVEYEKENTGFYAYKNGHVKSYTLAENTYTYDWNNLENNRYVRKTDSLGNQYQFDLAESGHITKYTDPYFKTTLYNIDETMSLSGSTDKLGNNWQQNVDEKGRITTDTTPLGAQTTYKYDGDRRKPSEVTSPLGHVTKIAYNENDNLTMTTLPDNSTFKNSYDSKGNILSATNASGVKTHSITYNDNSQPTSITNALGETLSISYTAYGQTGTVTDAEGNTITYTYDILGRLTKTVNEMGHESIYNYDAAGKLLSLQDPAGNTTTYTYDQYGRLATEARPKGRTLDYSYDQGNRLTTLIDSAGRETGFSYDKIGNITKVAVGSSYIQYWYDATNIITQAYDSNSRQTVYFTYDEDGRLSQEKQHNKAIDYSYDLDGKVASMTVMGTTISYSRNKLGTLSSLSDGTDTFHFTYDANGLRKSISYPNGLQTDYSVSDASRLVSLNNGLTQSSYTHDKNGMLTQETVAGTKINYSYDEAGRLTSAGTHTYNYDTAGNNLNNSAVYESNSNQLSETATHSYLYDAFGNLSKKTEKATGGYKVYVWNVWDQLSSVESFDSLNTSLKKIEFGYGPLGRRLYKTIDNVTEYYLYSGQNLIAATDYSSNLHYRIIHDETIDSPLSIINVANDKTYYYHKDHQGSIIGLSDSTQASVENYSYDAYGKTLKTASIETGNPFAYTAREMDDDDLYYYRARYYDPSIGRFLSEDPIGFAAGDFNFYRYVLNNPKNYLDPSGNLVVEIIGQSLEKCTKEVLTQQQYMKLAMAAYYRGDMDEFDKYYALAEEARLRTLNATRDAASNNTGSSTY